MQIALAMPRPQKKQGRCWPQAKGIGVTSVIV